MRRSGVRPVVAFLAVAVAGASLSARAATAQAGGTGSTAQRPADAAQSGRSDSRAFINDMAVAGMAEVQLGKMAEERASSADVKAFGQMMVKDHSKAGDELKQVAAQLQVQPPSQLDQKHRDLADRLSKLHGAEFDREYMNAMVQGHEEVLGKVRMRAGDRLTSNQPTAGDRRPPTSGAPAAAPATTPSTTGSAGTAVGTTGNASGEQALTQWAAKALPTVQEHLERARDLQQKVGK